MRWLDAALAALLYAPVTALLALALGLGHRFGARSEVWAGGAAAIAAVGAAGLSSISGLGPLANAVFTVPLVALVTYLLGSLVTTRPEIASDPARSFTASALLAIGAVALLIMFRTDHPVAAPDGGSRLELVGGSSVATAAVVSAAVALCAIVAVAVVVTFSRVRLRLELMDRAPELLMRSGHDARQVSAMFAALTAALGALGGVLAARHSAMAPSSAIGLTVLGAEAALLGGLGSIPGALLAASALSLLSGLGNEFRPGWGSLAAHAVVLAVLVLRHGNVGRWSEARLEMAR